MEAIVSNVNGIMSKRKMQEEAVQTEDGYMTTEEVQAQLLLVKDDIDFIRKGLEKERLTREQGIEELNDVMHKLRDAFNCTPKRICDEMVKVHSGFERLKEMQQGEFGGCLYSVVLLLLLWAALLLCSCSSYSHRTLWTFKTTLQRFWTPKRGATTGGRWFRLCRRFLSVTRLRLLQKNSTT